MQFCMCGQGCLCFCVCICPCFWNHFYFVCSYSWSTSHSKNTKWKRRCVKSKSAAQNKTRINMTKNKCSWMLPTSPAHLDKEWRLRSHIETLHVREVQTLQYTSWQERRNRSENYWCERHPLRNLCTHKSESQITTTENEHMCVLDLATYCCWMSMSAETHE